MWHRDDVKVVLGFVCFFFRQKICCILYFGLWYKMRKRIYTKRWEIEEDVRRQLMRTHQICTLSIFAGYFYHVVAIKMACCAVVLNCLLPSCRQYRKWIPVICINYKHIHIHSLQSLEIIIIIMMIIYLCISMQKTISWLINKQIAMEISTMI